MFIRPVAPESRPAPRPRGNPLLRGLLTSGVYVWDAARAPEGAGEDMVWGTAADEPPPPSPPSPPSPPAPAESGLAAELRALAALAAEGVLTPEEFTAAKHLLLTRP
ncbi:hypothetical protein LG634_09795 [Streptomyces bambusae]|uniref:hypothetical protein n=1 Tax=Streptomyces bambusae TaxID=1550616 RepID=UPI001CFCADD0|nr:hypothetical protein [Streptomyces bambusae]MCB5165120.1 hypothetical protein [Streptomyces bambusae]